jgi:hypothetical protein
MERRAWLGGVAVVLVSLCATGARAQDAGTASLAATDFALTVSRTTPSGTSTALTSDDLATYFSIARCACPTSVVVGLTLSSTAAATLAATDTVDAQIVVGSDCDIVTATACPSLGATLTLSASKLATTQSLTTASVFSAAGQKVCTAASSSSTRLWAIVRLNGTRLVTEPSLPLTLGGAGPAAPTAVKAVTAEKGLLVSWTPTGDATTLQGHQVVCSPGAATASAASYDTCAASTPDGGTGPFATLDPKFLCSGLVSVGTNSVRVQGLENGQTYDVAVVAVGIDGTPSAASTAAKGTPGPTYGFDDVYKQSGGTAQAGCSIAGPAAPTSLWAGGATLGLCVVWVVARRGRRKGRAALFAFAYAYMGAGLSGLAARPARAADDGPPFSLTAPIDAPAVASPRAWNIELRFAPYRPDVDSEFTARGSAARPYEQLFGSSRHLMMQLEVDRQLLHRGGTWSLGLGVGYMHVSGAALAPDLVTPSGDQTGLRLIPLSAALVYRADILRERYGSPLVPYAKLGLDCTLWHMSDTAEPSVDGRTFGWHAAAGVSLDLSILDPEDARTMDRETGVNQTAIFFEAARYSLDGFGSGSALHVGDTTWFAGLMFEL